MDRAIFWIKLIIYQVPHEKPLKIINYPNSSPNLREHQNLKLNPGVKMVKSHRKTIRELKLEFKSN